MPIRCHTPAMLKANEFGTTLASRLQQLRNDGDFVDCKIRLKTADGHSKELHAHRNVLASGSNFFKEAFKMKAEKEEHAEITLTMSNDGAVSCFESLLDFLYSGSLDTSKNDTNHLMQIAKIYQMKEAEEILQPYCREPTPPSTASLPTLPFSSVLFPSQSATLEALMSGSAISSSALMQNCNALEVQMQLARLTAQRLTQQPLLAPQLFSTILPQFAPFNFLPTSWPLLASLRADPPTTSSRKRKKASGHESDENDSLAMATESNEGSTEEGGETFDNMGDIIVPSSDREGWCRNKKYIERVANGFMCTVCRKVYGRYNSVSYHVTIYHRNPPIKCDEEGCQFSTREARYIHFHKFYRHRIPLPDSIDLGSRKCPFCRHISKSPAMLEKHISRHVADCSRAGTQLKCPHCDVEVLSQKEMLEHVVTHQQHDSNFHCEQCSYRGQSEPSLRQHVLFKHSADMFSRKITCELCQYACAEPTNLKSHYERMHPDYQPEHSKNEKGGSSSNDKSRAEDDAHGSENEVEINARCNIPVDVSCN
uniref:BTB domain-containing protein n=2 Tax=Parascaris univalens TaxID=6257 RepID=A0A914ZT78_PARUN